MLEYLPLTSEEYALAWDTTLVAGPSSLLSLSCDSWKP